MMLSWILALALMFEAVGAAQSNDSIVGTWKLISATNVTETRQMIENAYGHNPTGFLTTLLTAG